MLRANDLASRLAGIPHGFADTAYVGEVCHPADQHGDHDHERAFDGRGGAFNVRIGYRNGIGVFVHIREAWDCVSNGIH
jgi:hypothetical protein